jgi:cytochrome c-type biogenesis protein CcmF
MTGEDTDSGYSLTAAVTLLLGFWVIAMSIADVTDKLAGKLSRLTTLSGSYWGMICAHLGLAVCVLGVGLSSIYDVQKDVRMEPGDRAVVSGYEFEFLGIEQVQGPNYTAYQGQIKVQSESNFSTLMTPEKRSYSAGGQVMTEAAIDASLSRDLYVSLAEPLAGQAWAIRLQVKPFVRCIWLGGLMIALGGLLAALDKRYRRKRQRMDKAHAEIAGAGL